MLKKIISIIEWVIFLVVFATFFVVISPLLPTKKYFSTYIIPSGSMEPTVKAGSVAIITPANEIKINDIVAFTSPDNQKITILHRVTEVTDKGYKTKGDNNNSADNWIVPSVFVKGKMIYTIPYLGHPATLAKTPKGFALIVGLPAFLLVALQVKKIRDGIEEEVKRRVEKQAKNLPTNLLILALAFSLVLVSSAIPIANAEYFSKATISNVAFSVKDFVPPPVPTLISPLNGISRNTLGMVMDWSDVSDYGNMNNPVYYIYQSARNSGFSPLAYQSGHLSSSFIPASGTPSGTYWWRVKACDAINNCSAWSDAWMVVVDNTAPGTATMTVTGSWTKTVDEKITNNWTMAGDVATVSGAWLIGKTSGDNGNMVWEDRLMQSFNSGAKTLSFDYDFHTLDSSGYDEPGFFARLNGQQIFSMDAATGDSGWKTFSYNLSNYADGQKLNLALYAGNTGGSDQQSWVYINKVTTTFVAAPKHATFNLSGSDSDINHFEYKIDGSTWVSGNSFTDLSEGSHTLSYRAVDNAGNVGPTSVTKIVTDDTKPSAITDLSVIAATNSATLTWTAPGNDGTIGRASIYDVRYSTTPISDFSTATKVEKVPAPKSSGEIESLEILGLNPTTTYYFAIKSSDEAPNESAISNIISATTLSGATINPGDLVINEIMWGGVSANWFVEIRNMTDRFIPLLNMKLMFNVTTDLACNISAETIAPHGYFVINTSNCPALTFMGGNFEMELQNNGMIVDQIGDGLNVFAGDNAHSMERTSVPGVGTNPLSWYTCLEGNTMGVVNRSVNEPIVVKTILASPSISIYISTQSASFKVINLTGFEKLSYTLTYDSDLAVQGVQGVALLQGVKEFEKTGILLGTCSTGGTCVYHTGVKNILLKVKLTDKDGKVTSLEKTQ